MKYESIKVNSDFMKFYDSLEKLNEAFTYTEDEILSDEEVKEIEAKFAEIDKRRKELWELSKKAISEEERKQITQEQRELYNISNSLSRKLSKHEAIMKYKSDSAAMGEDHIATEEEWDNCLAEFTDLELEVDGLEIDVYREEDEYPSGWNPMTDSIIYTTVPAGTGTITSWTITVDATKEWIADFIGKKIEEVTAKDLLEFMYGDYEDFIEYLTERDDVLKLIEEDALENYEYDDVEWYEYEPEYDPDDYWD